MRGSCQREHSSGLRVFFSARMRGTKTGMTMVEVVVMMAIIVVISAILVGGVPLFNQTQYVKKEAERAALDLRAAQNNAIIGRVAPSSGTTPPYWGVHVSAASPAEYVVFADTNGDKVYTAGVDEIVSTVSFENGVSIASLSSPQGSEQELNFVFSVPYGDTEIDNASGSVGSYGKIELASRIQRIARFVTMRVSGQISITEQ